MLKYLILALLVVIGYTVQSTTGFGSNVMVLAIGAQLFNINELIVVLVMLSLVQCAWLIARGYRNIQWGILLKIIIPYCILGMSIGINLRYSMNVNQLKIFFGIFLIILSTLEIYRLYRDQNLSTPMGFISSRLVLITAGIIHGVYTSGGPLVVYFTSRQIEKKSEFRSTLAMLWFVLDSLLLFTFAMMTQINVEKIRLASILLPMLIIGIIVGEILHNRVDELLFKKIVQFILLFSGISLLF